LHIFKSDYGRFYWLSVPLERIKHAVQYALS
jgi:hypothetical protein